jgi:hypothetical protein
MELVIGVNGSEHMTDIEAINLITRQIEALSDELKTLQTQEYVDAYKAAIDAKQLAISALRDRSVMTRMKKRLDTAVEYKSYWDSLYGQGLEVAFWHKNGNTEPLDSFIESADELWNKEK